MITRFEETEKNLVLEFSCRSPTPGEDGDKEGINNFTTLGGGIRTCRSRGSIPVFDVADKFLLGRSGTGNSSI